MSRYHDAKEVRPSSEREADLFSALPEFIAGAVAGSQGWRARLGGTDAAAITSRGYSCAAQTRAHGIAGQPPAVRRHDAR